jgi:hypothetical protein
MRPHWSGGRDHCGAPAGAGNRTFVLADDGRVIGLSGSDVLATRLVADGSGADWSLEARTGGRAVPLSGAAARRPLGALLARVNQFGARELEIEDALTYLERAGGPAEHLERTSRTAPELARLRPEILLSVEIAVTESREDEALAAPTANWKRSGVAPSRSPRSRTVCLCRQASHAGSTDTQRPGRFSRRWPNDAVNLTGADIFEADGLTFRCSGRRCKHCG